MYTWASVSTPTIVVDGSASLPWMHAAAEAFAGALPDARRHAIEGQQHDVAPELLAPVLKDLFLN
jgi:hypothetical protein